MPNLIALAIPLFFAAIGVELLVARARHRSVYRLGTALADMGCGITQQLTGVVVGAFALGVYGWAYEHRFFTLPEKSAASWLAAVVGVELAYYWWHRLSHEVNILWAAHVVHHHSEDYNLAVALRQSMTTWATGLPFYVPLAFLGVPTFEYAVVLSLSTLYQFWVHTELVPPLGWFDRWFNSPSLHRVHHATNPRFLDRNHAATFMVFDRLFGTYQVEDEPCVYGTTQPLRSYNVWWAQVAGYVEVVRLARRAPSLGQALKVVFGPPGWRPDWLGPQPDAAPKAPARAKYAPATTRGTWWYALLQFALLIIGVFSFLMWGHALSRRSFWLCLGAFFFAVLTLPPLLESKAWARPLEAIRLVATVAVAAAVWHDVV